MKQSIRLILLLLFISIHGAYAQRTMFAYALNYQRILHHYRSNELFSKGIADNLNKYGENTNLFANGFILQNKLLSNWSLSNGFFIGKFRFINGDVIGKTGGNAFFISSPITTNYNFRFGKIDPTIGLGFNNYLALFSTSEDEYSGSPFDNLNPAMRRYTISALLQAGINLAIGQESRLRVQFEFEQHLRPVTSGSVRLNPTGLGISVGYYLLVR